MKTMSGGNFRNLMYVCNLFCVINFLSFTFNISYSSVWKHHNDPERVWLIEGSVTVIMEGLRKSWQTFVRAADTQTYRINFRVLSSVNFIIMMIKTTSGYQFESTIKTANYLDVLVHTYIHIHTHTHTLQ